MLHRLVRRVQWFLRRLDNQREFVGEQLPAQNVPLDLLPKGQGHQWHPQQLTPGGQRLKHSNHNIHKSEVRLNRGFYGLSRPTSCSHYCQRLGWQQTPSTCNKTSSFPRVKALRKWAKHSCEFCEVKPLSAGKCRDRLKKNVHKV